MMKLGFMVAGILLANLSAPAYALSLKLSPEIDLLVVDGKQVSGPILKGADSLELDAGQHQLLFQISKNMHLGAAPQTIYHSPPIIVAFNAQNLHAVSISLPPLTTEQEGRDFSQKMNIALLDEKGNQISYRQDRLLQIKDANPANLEAAMTQYNLSGHPASIPAFALTKKSAMTLNASRTENNSALHAENVTASVSFSLWSMLRHTPRIDSTIGEFSAH
ncbi:DUF2057 family protein [Rouxiella sp. WC2420]|uniref:DUF2057 family protein n=1 Tax=Rouxiella sp. WC2420 TaxID=3234145 RepID=A0AB39VM74_9GAMM